MTSYERINQIESLIQRSRRISLDEISERFDVSVATARRDLDYLAEQGKIQRVRGGAIRVENAPPEMPVFQRQEEQAAEKARAGKGPAAPGGAAEGGEAKAGGKPDEGPIIDAEVVDEKK